MVNRLYLSCRRLTSAGRPLTDHKSWGRGHTVAGATFAPRRLWTARTRFKVDRKTVNLCKLITEECFSIRILRGTVCVIHDLFFRKDTTSDDGFFYRPRTPEEVDWGRVSSFLAEAKIFILRSPRLIKYVTTLQIKNAPTRVPVNFEVGNDIMLFLCNFIDEGIQDDTMVFRAFSILSERDNQYVENAGDRLASRQEGARAHLFDRTLSLTKAWCFMSAYLHRDLNDAAARRAKKPTAQAAAMRENKAKAADMKGDNGHPQGTGG